jgi:PIN domain nuclease of toxin-antitoxin system
VNGNLLDTNSAIFALALPERLSSAARKAIMKGPNVISVVSFWEVLLKSMKGTLDVGDPRAWWHDALEQLAAISLSLRPEHFAGIYSLPAHHKDPFDRVLIAQATIEGLNLLTSDAEIARYSSTKLKVVR